jgi:pSer/pThr/pTyr-binding forkhead associated (FHA) protein
MSRGPGLPPPPGSVARLNTPPGGQPPVPAVPHAVSSGRSIPPPLPRAPGAPAPPAPVSTPGRISSPPGSGQGVYSGTLSVVYNSERLAITKDRFVIGRGKQSSDLTIKDPNVSRQHAMIEFLNGQYYMVDMGSTNGVEFQGQRVSRRAIGEGDVFKICDHEVRFTYH